LSHPEKCQKYKKIVSFSFFDADVVAHDKAEFMNQIKPDTVGPCYMREIGRDSKNRLAYNEFAYKKTKDDC